MNLIYAPAALLIGLAIGYLVANSAAKSKVKAALFEQSAEIQNLTNNANQLAGAKAILQSELDSANKKISEMQSTNATIEELAATLSDQFHLPMARVRTRVLAPRPARVGGQPVTSAPQWQVLLTGHAHFARATYSPGNRTVDLERSSAGLLEALKRLHKAEAGQAGFILLADGFAGALLFLILSGTLIWTRLAGPRLLSAGLALGGLLALLGVASRAW